MRRVASPVQREKVAALLQDHLARREEIQFAYLHGSFLEERSYRDLDVAVFLDARQVQPERWRRYELDLAVELQLVLAQPVDVRLLNDAGLAFRYHAARGRPLGVRDPEGQAEFRARTWDDYFDFLPFARQYLRDVLSG